MRQFKKFVAGSILSLAVSSGSTCASEVVDIVFVLDFSGSTSSVEQQMEDAVVEFLDGPNTVIPRDSSVAISVVRMLAGPHYTIFPLTLLDSESTVDSLVNQIRTFDHTAPGVNPDPYVSCTTAASGGCSGSTSAYQTICRVGEILDSADPMSQFHHLFFFSDLEIGNGDQVDESAELLRTRTTPVKISVIITEPNDGPCESTGTCSPYMRAQRMANTPIAGTYDPTQIEGGTFCYTPDVSFESFGVMSVCDSIDPFDSGTNGIPDICEPDDNSNGIPDDVDIANDSTLDCNDDGILDEVQMYHPLQYLQQPAGIPSVEIGDRFGESISTDGVTVAIGSPNDHAVEQGIPGFYYESGAVYVYTQSDADSSWTLRGSRVVPPVISGHSLNDALFGKAVVVEGDRLVVGAPDYNASNGDTGAVFVYEFDDTLDDWVYQNLLTPADSLADDFGHSLALQGDRLLVGDPLDDPSGFPSNYGSVSYFEYDFGTNAWNLTKELTLQDAFDSTPSDDRFGHAVAFVGDAIVGSAIRKDYDVNGSTRSNAGVVYSFYEQSNGVFLPGAPLTGREFSTTVDPDEFGFALSGSGDFLAIGTPEYDNGLAFQDSGRVFVYELDTTQTLTPTWITDTMLLAHDREDDDEFGHALSIEDDQLAGTTIAISALSDSNPTGFNNGSAYLFRREAQGDWDLLAKLFPQEDSDGSTYFGQSIAYSFGDTFVGTVDDSSTSNHLDGDLQRVDYFGPIPGCGGCSDADMAQPYGELNFFDISAFLSAYRKADPSADINGDGEYNFFDISGFLVLFQQGCP